MNNDLSIVFHLGAPYTDNDLLTWSLRKDSQLLAENGVMIRRPSRYRTLINDMLRLFDGDVVPSEDQKAILQSIIKQQSVDRLILSDSKFMGVSPWMLNNGILYQNAGRKTAELRKIFADNPAEFFLGISNPAIFLSEAFINQNRSDYGNFFDGIDLFSVRWSDVIARIQQSNPGCPITIWSNEDTPIIWPTILCEVTGLDHRVRFAGELDVIRALMPEESVERLEKFLQKSPHLNEFQRRQVRAVFLEKFSIDDAVEEEIDLPGWTDETIEAMSEVYSDDLEKIERMPGVKFISI